MKAALRRRLPGAFVILLPAALAFGCVAPDGYYGGAPGYGLDYYEPYGAQYGGWASGYLVAPFREGRGREGEPDYRAEHGGHEAPHAFRAAPAGRVMPSIPSTPRGGGGGHGGGPGGPGGGGGHGH